MRKKSKKKARIDLVIRAFLLSAEMQLFRCGYSTSRLMVVVCVVLPLLPVMVMVRVPVAGLRLVVIFIVEVPAPVMELGLKVMVTPLPWPEADKEMAESKPPVTVVVMVTLAELLRFRLTDVGEALMEKPAEEEVTARETVVVSVVLPEVPVMVTA